MFYSKLTGSSFMNKRTLASILAFVITFVVSFLLIQKFITKPQSDQIAIKKNDDYGLAVGETVNLPDLQALNGQTTKLNNIKEEHLLLGFFSTTCPGCSKDSELWQKLKEEAEKNGVGFHLISVDKDKKRIDKFAKAYEFDNLSVLFDATGNSINVFKIDFVPEYLLISKSGKVIGRWEGLGGNGKESQVIEDISKFFKPLQK